MGISVHTEEGILWGFWAWTLVFGFVGVDLGIWLVLWALDLGIWLVLWALFTGILGQG